VPEEYSVDVLSRRDLPAREAALLYRFSSLMLYAGGFAGVALGFSSAVLGVLALVWGLRKSSPTALLVGRRFVFLAPQGGTTLLGTWYAPADREPTDDLVRRGSAALLAEFRAAPQNLINELAALFLIVRIAYVLTYLGDRPTLRSILWSIGLAINLAIFFMPAIRGYLPG